MRLILICLTLALFGCTATAGQLAFYNPHHNQHPTTSIYTVLKQGFTLDHHASNPRVRHFIRYYQRHPKILSAVLQTSDGELFTIIQALNARHMPLELALLPAVESGYRLNVTSSSGAKGLWQLMPGTADDYGVTMDNHWFDGRLDLDESTYAALDMLNALHHDLHNDWLLAVAAYNSGEKTVQRAMAKAHHHNFFKLDLPNQTRDYVPKWLAICSIIASTHHDGIRLPTLLDTNDVTKVYLTHPMSLFTAAHAAHMSLSDFKSLNPAYLNNATPRLGPSYVYIPTSKAYRFKHALGNGKSVHHVITIQPGDTLAKIAKKYHTNSDELATVNGIDEDAALFAGDKLIIR